MSANEVIPWDTLPPELSWKEKIGYLCVMLADSRSPPSPVEHVLGHGLYIRKIAIPAGTIFLGREHLKGHQVTLLEGSAIMITPTQKIRYDAVNTIETVPGFHMVAYMLTDVIAQTVHHNPNNLTDTKALEDEIFGPVEDLMTLGHQVQLRLT